MLNVGRLVKEKIEVAQVWAAANVWLKYRSCLVVIVPKLQKQQRGLYNCAYFPCAYMADMVSATDIFGAMYVDGQVQRNWFKNCLLNTAVVACPRLSERPSRF